MTVRGVTVDVFLWKEAKIETDAQDSGLKLLRLYPEGSASNIYFMSPTKLDELILKLQELKGGDKDADNGN